MSVRVVLGEGWSLGPDGDGVGLLIVARYSIDGSSALRLLLGWFRLVCANGLIVGVTLGQVRMAHTESFDRNRALDPTVFSANRRGSERNGDRR